MEERARATIWRFKKKTKKKVSPETVELGVGDKDYWTKETKRMGWQGWQDQKKKKKSNAYIQINGTESRIQKYSHLIFNKLPRPFNGGKTVFQTNSTGTMDTQMRKNELGL